MLCDHLAANVTPNRVKYMVSLWPSFAPTRSKTDINNRSQHSFLPYLKSALECCSTQCSWQQPTTEEKHAGGGTRNGNCHLGLSSHLKFFGTMTATCDETLPYLVSEVFLQIILVSFCSELDLFHPYQTWFTHPLILIEFSSIQYLSLVDCPLCLEFVLTLFYFEYLNLHRNLQQHY